VIEPGEDGTSSVTFAPPGTIPPYVPFSTAPVQVSRLTGSQSSPERAASVESRADAAIAPAPEPGQTEEERRELDYEYFLERLRRDLVAEREQYGSLLNHNP
jgi:hypothetical protein